MTTEIKTWQIIDGKLIPMKSSLIDSGLKEKEHLEQWIKSNPRLLGDDIAIIGEQVQTESGPMDFLGIDSSGNTVIIELKRDKLPREALLQVIDYASDVSDWEIDRFQTICKTYTDQTFEDFFQQRFEGVSLEDLAINQVQRLLLVGFAMEGSLGRMIEWLSDKYNLGVNAVLLNYVKTSNGDEIISRMAIIPEEVEKQKANKKKFIIEMSNEPGVYDDDTLEQKLIDYLSKNLYSSQRIRDYFLPILLEKGRVTRDQLRKEFVKRNVANDESQAGYFLSLISSQLGHKWKDYLRQVIEFEFPNHPWEKDNFKIKDGYHEVVKSVLEKLKNQKE